MPVRTDDDNDTGRIREPVVWHDDDHCRRARRQGGECQAKKRIQWERHVVRGVGALEDPLGNAGVKRKTRGGCVAEVFGSNVDNFDGSSV
jgi:hypothetical protein